MPLEDTRFPDADRRTGCCAARYPGVASGRGVRHRSSMAVGAGLSLILPLLPSGAAAQQQAAPVATMPIAAAPLVFDQVTVVDVDHGKLLPQQRVVIIGTRVQRVGAARAVRLPAGAQVVNAHSKYLIPGLWDMHIHPMAEAPYSLLLTLGITGIRIPGSPVPLDTLRRWRQEILAGARVGPPRQVLSGPALDEGTGCEENSNWPAHICTPPGDSMRAQFLIDSLKAAGSDMLKVYSLHRQTYFLVAAAARRAGLLFGGHDQSGVSAIELSDSGQRLIDHPGGAGTPGPLCLPAGLQTSEYATTDSNQGTVERCRVVAERFRRNGTWWVPTLCCGNNGVVPQGPTTRAMLAQFGPRSYRLWYGPPLHGDWLRDPIPDDQSTTVVTYDTAGRRRALAAAANRGLFRIAQQVGLPIVAGTDARLVDCGDLWSMPPGLTLHQEIATYVGEGLTPLAALQSATLNPAKAIRGTDSLGTVAVGKLADLVLLEGNPLEDITNTTAIAAVVANGRYFDRAALDQVLTEFQTRIKQGFPWWGFDRVRDPHTNQMVTPIRNTKECELPPP